VGKGDSEETREPDPSGPLSAFVFKTVSDPFVGHITMFRVFSGSVKPDSTVFDATAGTEERIGQLFTLRGKEHENVPSVGAGDIGAVAKLQHAHTGDTWSTKDHPVTLPSVSLPEPLLAYAIAPASKGEEDKLATGLTRLREEDPSFRVRSGRGDPPDRDLRDGRGAPGRPDAPAQGEVRRRRRARAREDRVSRDDQRARRRATAGT
jgi:elongation factor G